MVKMRHEGKVEKRAIYTAIGINVEDQKSVPGLWASTDEGAKHRMAVLTNLKNRGMKDAFIACTDGLQGFPGAIEAIFPSTLVQTCIVHLIRASLAVCELERAQSDGRRAEVDLPRRERGNGGVRAGIIS